MPDIDTVNIITINYNRIDTQETDRANKCSKNSHMPGFKAWTVLYKYNAGSWQS